MTTSLSVYIGRFQPFHLGHEHTLHRMPGDHKLLIYGSVSDYPTYKNPWSSYVERCDMLHRSVPSAFMVGMRDIPESDDDWRSRVIETVNKYVEITHADSVTLVHAGLPDTPYVKWFPGWNQHVVTPKFQITGTAVRKAFFMGNPIWRPMVPYGTVTYLEAWKKRNLDCFNELRKCAERDYFNV